MATGDKTSATRPLGTSNQRLDLVDYASLAVTAQAALEADTRGVIASPKAVAGAATGERWTGSMTGNPTSGTDGLFRLDSPVFVGLDANGGLLIKPNGTALSVAVPAGGSNQQIYAYVSDVPENTQVRRFLPATTPFTEFGAAVNVALRQTVGLFVRAGTLGSVVAEDVVAGATRPLLFLGIATNTGGVVVFTPGTNTLESVSQPAIFPANSAGTTVGGTTTTGSQATMRELLNAALYLVGQLAWKGSANLVPSAANNFGAYTTPPVGVDKIGRDILDTVTIGDGVTVFGTLDRTAFSSDDLLLSAAITTASLRAGAGNICSILIKPGVRLTNFAGNVTIPASCRTTITGVGGSTTLPQIDITTAFGFLMTNATTSQLRFEDLFVRTNGLAAIVKMTGVFSARNCTFTRNNSAATVAMFLSDTASATVVPDCAFVECVFNDTGVTANDATKYAFIDTGTSAANGILTRLVLSRCRFVNSTNFAHRGIRIGNISEGLDIDDCKFVSQQTVAAAPTVLLYWLELTDPDGTFTLSNDRKITGCTFSGAATHAAQALMCGILLKDVCGMTLSQCDFQRMARPLECGVATNGGCQDLRINSCRFVNRAGGVTTPFNANTYGGLSGTTRPAALLLFTTLNNVTISNCYFEVFDLYHTDATVSVNTNIAVQDCTFIDCSCLIGDPFSGVDVSSKFGVLLTDNIFRRTGSAITPYIPLRTQGTALRQVTVRGCTFRGFAQPATNLTALCIDFGGSNNLVTTMEQLAVDSCTFIDCDNETMNYTGTAGGTDTLHSLIQLSATSTLADIVITRCRATQIANNQVKGSAANIFHVTFVGHHTANAGPVRIQGMLIQGNAIGDDTSHCGMYAMFGSQKTRFESLKIEGNSHIVALNDVNYDDNWGGYNLVIPSTDVSVHDVISIVDNTAFVVNVSGASGASGPIYRGLWLRDGALTAVFAVSVLLIANNTISVSAAGLNTIAGTYQVSAALGGLTVVNNVARRSDLRTGTVDVAVTRFAGAIGRSIPAKPGAGITWTNNNGLIDQ